jgi:hypothetical protein
MENKPKPSAVQAVIRGHLIVTLPVFVIIGLTTGVAAVSISVFTPNNTEIKMQLLHALRLPLGGLAGCLLGWLWWSASVPRWREWAKSIGADEEQTQRLGQRTLLVWPKGWFFEKTEFRRRKPTNEPSEEHELSRKTIIPPPSV